VAYRVGDELADDELQALEHVIGRVRLEHVPRVPPRLTDGLGARREPVLPCDDSLARSDCDVFRDHGAESGTRGSPATGRFTGRGSARLAGDDCGPAQERDVGGRRDCGDQRDRRPRASELREDVRSDEARQDDEVPPGLPAWGFARPTASEKGKDQEDEPAERADAGRRGHAEADRQTSSCADETPHRL
jgi:hypothetical protein